MSEELKACPFCGSGALVMEYPCESPNMFAIECSSCWCALGKDYDHSAMPDFDFGDLESAIEAWNRRSTKESL